MKPTSRQLKQLPKLYSQDGNENPIAYLHFYNLFGRGDWYATEGRQEGDDFLMFGYVKSPLGADCDEWGYFTLNQILSAKLIFDTRFKPTPIKEVI